MKYFGVEVLFLNALTDIANRKSEKIHAVIFGCYFLRVSIFLDIYVAKKKHCVDSLWSGTTFIVRGTRPSLQLRFGFLCHFIQRRVLSFLGLAA